MLIVFLLSMVANVVESEGVFRRAYRNRHSSPYTHVTSRRENQVSPRRPRLSDMASSTANLMTHDDTNLYVLRTRVTGNFPWVYENTEGMPTERAINELPS
jgi:hypothetical protein